VPPQSSQIKTGVAQPVKKEQKPGVSPNEQTKQDPLGKTNQQKAEELMQLEKKLEILSNEYTEQESLARYRDSVLRT